MLATTVPSDESVASQLDDILTILTHQPTICHSETHHRFRLRFKIRSFGLPIELTQDFPNFLYNFLHRIRSTGATHEDCTD